MFLPAALGCVEIDEVLTIYADGSGKLLIRLALNPATLPVQDDVRRDLRERHGLPFPVVGREEFRDPANFLGPFQGVRATRPGPFQEDGTWIRTSLTLYFQDIDKVRIVGLSDDAYATLTREAGGGTLTLFDARAFLSKGLREARGRQGKSLEEALAGMENSKRTMRDFRYRRVVVLPGEARESSLGMSLDGREARWQLDWSGVMALARASADPPPRGRLTWSGDAVPPGEREAFAAELEGRPAPEPPPAPIADDELERRFIDAQLKVAREQIAKGRKDQARATLEAVLKDFPKAKAALEAKKLLETLRP